MNLKEIEKANSDQLLTEDYSGRLVRFGVRASTPGGWPTPRLRSKKINFSAFVGQDQGLLRDGAKFTDEDSQVTNLSAFTVALRTASSGLRLLFPF